MFNAKNAISWQLLNIKLKFYSSFSLEEFPYDLFNSNLDEFIHNNESVVVPLLLWHCPKTEVMSKLAKILHKKEKHLILDNFVSLAAICLPYLAEAQKSKMAEKLYEFIKTIIQDNRFNENLCNVHLFEVIAHVLQRLDDPEHFQMTFGITMETKDHYIYPGLSVQIFQRIIKFFELQSK